MTKPVLFRLTKTMVKLIKVYYINTLEIGGGGGAYLHFLFGIFYNFQFHSGHDQASPIQIDENNKVDKGILYKHTGNWGWGGAYLHFLCIWYIL